MSTRSRVLGHPQLTAEHGNPAHYPKTPQRAAHQGIGDTQHQARAAAKVKPRVAVAQPPISEIIRRDLSG